MQRTAVMRTGKYIKAQHQFSVNNDFTIWLKRLWGMASKRSQSGFRDNVWKEACVCGAGRSHELEGWWGQRAADTQGDLRRSCVRNGDFYSYSSFGAIYQNYSILQICVYVCVCGVCVCSGGTLQDSQAHCRWLEHGSIKGDDMRTAAKLGQSNLERPLLAEYRN